MIVDEEFRFATGVDNNGFQDETIMPTLSSRPILMNMLDHLDPFIIKKIGITSRHAVYNSFAINSFY